MLLLFSATSAPTKPRGLNRRDARRVTLGAEPRSPSYHSLKGNIPFMSFKAAKRPHCHLEVAPFDPYRLAIEHGVSHLLPGGSKDTGKGRAGNTHALSTLFLLQTLQVLEMYCLGLFNGKADLLNTFRRHPGWCEICYSRNGDDTAPLWQSAHSIPFPLDVTDTCPQQWNCGLMLIIMITWQRCAVK